MKHPIFCRRRGHRFDSRAIKHSLRSLRGALAELCENSDFEPSQGPLPWL